jgi:hypothetical protein
LSRGWRYTQIRLRQKRLQLFEQNENKGDLVFLSQILERRFLYRLYIQMQVFVSLQNARSVIEHVFEEFSQQEGRPFVLLLCQIKSFLELQVFLL